MQSSSAQVTHRPEIDGLRGIAVVAVILNHFFEELLTSGFLGVDVFYVISGYVITGYLTRTSANSWYEYLEVFYSRRVKRLLPALLVCVVLTGAIFLIVAPNPSMEIFKTGQLALLGFSNVYLFFSSNDYFSLNAKLNLYTQTWSLGVEEQFYLVFPIILGALGLGGGRRPFHINAHKIIIGMTGVSLGLYVITNFISPSAAFYLMPLRFWELSAGAIAFLNRANERPPKSQVFLLYTLYFYFARLFFRLNFKL